jgi:hypothetical protein
LNKVRRLCLAVYRYENRLKVREYDERRPSRIPEVAELDLIVSRTGRG